MATPFCSICSAKMKSKRRLESNSTEKRAYRDFVIVGIKKESSWKDLKGKIFLEVVVDKVAGFFEELHHADATNSQSPVPPAYPHTKNPPSMILRIGLQDNSCFADNLVVSFG